MCDYAEEKRSWGSAVTSCSFERCRSSDVFRSRRLVRQDVAEISKLSTFAKVWQAALAHVSCPGTRERPWHT